MALSSSGRAGELINQDSLFDFEGQDISGMVWTAEGVDTAGGNHVLCFIIREDAQTST
ncbi:hypothetical protein PSYMO_20528 [Pseudomonas amygdali pv. mori str. 301020]|uniref:Uncharacterized protein n=1 Tax=Pseudomonas amygdali pv. mori str. 301020 TaxID=629261 RepID=A0A656GDS7_PSEA0|nr:hypothetical protein PSYMO_20528 [Pseudomonas amygdali pv. mori str. 301020]